MTPQIQTISHFGLFSPQLSEDKNWTKIIIWSCFKVVNSVSLYDYDHIFHWIFITHSVLFSGLRASAHVRMPLYSNNIVRQKNVLVTSIVNGFCHYSISFVCHSKFLYFDGTHQFLCTLCIIMIILLIFWIDGTGFVVMYLKAKTKLSF